MPNIIAISGSLRKNSFNSALLRAAVDLAPSGLSIAVGTIRDIPLYDGDVEAASGIPAPVDTLKDQVAAAEGLLLFTPEYNQSVPGVFKNAIDWLSRPATDIPRVFGNKPVGLLGATPGPGGTRLSQTAWLPVLRGLGAVPWFGKQYYLAGAGQMFDVDGKLADAKSRQLLVDYLAGFSKFVAAHTSAAR
jgi:NAD(P)H-dependent FMN reductase